MKHINTILFIIINISNHIYIGKYLLVSINENKVRLPWRSSTTDFNGIGAAHAQTFLMFEIMFLDIYTERVRYADLAQIWNN
jgi:hypothetical protein